MYSSLCFALVKLQKDISIVREESNLKATIKDLGPPRITPPDLFSTKILKKAKTSKEAY